MSIYVHSLVETFLILPSNWNNAIRVVDQRLLFIHDKKITRAPTAGKSIVVLLLLQISPAKKTTVWDGA